MVGSEESASRAMVEVALLVMAAVARTARFRFAEGGEGVGCFAGLRDYQYSGIVEGVGGAVAVFAGVFDVYSEACVILEHDFAGESGVATGAAGGNDESLASAENLGEFGKASALSEPLGA